MLTQDRLKELVNYDPDTGVFTSKVFRSKCPVGKVIGTVRPDGYRVITIDKERYLAHRLAWLYVHGFIPQYIDHVDCDPSNNRISNLREATKSENQHNGGLRVNNSSGVKGVAWDNERQRWIVVIGIDGGSKFIGRFDDLAEAEAAAIRARAELHGEFANNG